MIARGLYLSVFDRPGALERVLGMARRRAMHLRPDSLVRGTDGRWSVLFHVTSETAEIDHYVSEFLELHDLDEALPVGGSTSNPQPERETR
jgi:acetolactate synthase regulatory subunit